MLSNWISSIYIRLNEHKKISSEFQQKQQFLDIILQICGTLTLGISLIGLGISIVMDTSTLSKIMNSMVVGFNLSYVVFSAINKGKEYGKNSESHFNSYKNFLDLITDLNCYQNNKWIKTDEEAFIYLKSRLDHLLLDAPLLPGIKNGIFLKCEDLKINENNYNSININDENNP